MIKTTERIYDDTGRLVREIVTEYEAATDITPTPEPIRVTLPPLPPFQPVYPISDWPPNLTVTCEAGHGHPLYGNRVEGVAYIDDYRRTPPFSV